MTRNYTNLLSKIHDDETVIEVNTIIDNFSPNKKHLVANTNKQTYVNKKMQYEKKNSIESAKKYDLNQNLYPDNVFDKKITQSYEDKITHKNYPKKSYIKDSRFFEPRFINENYKYHNNFDFHNGKVKKNYNKIKEREFKEIPSYVGLKNDWYYCQKLDDSRYKERQSGHINYSCHQNFDKIAHENYFHENYLLENKKMYKNTKINDINDFDNKSYLNDTTFDAFNNKNNHFKNIYNKKSEKYYESFINRKRSLDINVNEKRPVCDIRSGYKESVTDPYKNYKNVILRPIIHEEIAFKNENDYKLLSKKNKMEKNILMKPSNRIKIPSNELKNLLGHKSSEKLNTDGKTDKKNLKFLKNFNSMKLDDVLAIEEAAFGLFMLSRVYKK